MSSTNLTQFLRDLWLQGVEFWLEGDQLRFRGNKQIVSGDNLTLLRDNKSAIIEVIKQDPHAYLGFPLSHGQRGIFLMQHLDLNSSAYNLTCCLQLQTAINTSILESSFDFLLQRHAPLRMAIKTLDGHLAQQVSYSLPSILTITSVEKMDDTTKNSWIKSIADKPFDLSNEPLIRANLCVDKSTGRYYLLLVAHHIVADFWALDVFIKELAIIYTANLTQTTPALPDIGKLYKDYVFYERQWLDSTQGNITQNFWLEKLNPIPPTLDLRTDFQRPAKPTFNGSEYKCNINTTLTIQLKQKAKEAHVTPFVWVLSTYQTLLHRYTGQDCIAIGSPMACRMQHDFQLLAGHFTNPVILLSNFATTTHFIQLLEYNKNQLLQAIKHQEYPIQCLLEDLQKRQKNTSPLFQVALSWNQQQNSIAKDNALIESLLVSEQRGAIYDVVLTAFDKGDGIDLSWRFNSDLFKESTIARLAEHFLLLLEHTLSNTNDNIQQWDFRTQEEISTLKKINNTSNDFAKNTNIAQLFTLNAQTYANNIAIKEGSQLHSYAELNLHANQIANYLQSLNIKAGQHIAISLPRSYQLLAYTIACLKMGCIYVPIDTSYPADRIDFMLQQTQAVAFISFDKTHKTETQHTFSPTAIEPLVKQQSTVFSIAANGHCADDDIACVLFTSGSTGVPKGVNIPHRAITRLTTNTNYMAVKPSDKIAHLSNISFDAYNFETWSALLNGACLLCVDKNTLLTPQQFADFVKHEKPDIALITTALFNIFISYKADLFQHLRYMFVGGEALDIHTIAQCLENGKPENLTNLYGPTENGTVSTAYTINTLNPLLTSIPIGTPISNSQCYVHDKYGTLAPTGVIGEIIVGGEGIAAGYLGQQALSAEKFTPDNYRGKGLLYATGDLGYISDDGQLMYAGRKDNQIKIRGYRIELGEIENCLAKYPGIKQCCVIVNDDSQHKILLAYFSAASDLDINDIKTYLRTSLPEFMVPAAIQQLDAIPINSNGKIDKALLPKITIEKHNDYVAPRNSTEESLQAIWQKLLQQEHIGIFDNFFEIGGHSLLAMQTAAAIEQQLQCAISMRTLFEHPNIADLAAFISTPNANALPAITHQQDKTRIKASLNQQRLWFLQQLNPQSTAYNMPIALRVINPLPVAEIEWCLQYLIQRHETLHTRFIDDNGIAYLHIDNTETWALEHIDLTQLSINEGEEKAKQHIADFAHQSFDLANDHLLKAQLISLTNQQQLLAISLHHAIIDGGSVNIVLQELAELWQHRKTGKVIALKPISIDYSDFSVWQHATFTGNALQAQLDYWVTQLNNAPSLINLPTDKPRPAVLGHQGAEYCFTIPKQTINKLKNLSQSNGATLFMSLLATYSLLLSRYSQQQDLCIGFPIAGRNQKAIEHTVGLFVNNLVARCNLSENISFESYLQQIKTTVIGAYAHQDIPFDQIIDALKLERSQSYIPLLQASFSLEDAHINNKISQVMGNDIIAEPIDWHVAKYDIHLICFNSDDGSMTASIDYNKELFEEATIARMSGHFVALLNAIANNATQAINDIEFLSQHEYQQQMDFEHGFNATAFAHPKANSIHQLFEQQVIRTPNAIAIVDDEGTLSYIDLNKQANQLAHYLRSLDVKRNAPVAVYIERSRYMSIALLAILKAGGAYVPLTTDIPANRVNYICRDTKAKVFISSTDIDISELDINAAIVLANQADWQQQATSNIDAGNQSDDVFNIIYTSGSTGNPKGVMVPHRGIINRLQWMQYAYPLDANDKVLQKTPFNFDVSVWELFWPLLQGSQLIYAKPEGHKDPDYLRDIIIQHRISTLHFVPSMLGIFLQTPSVEQCISLRQVFTSGEALQLTHSTDFFSHLPQAGLFNLYGPTEASIDVSYYNCIPNETHSSIAIGKPIHNTQLHILDQSLKVLPIGVAGDLYIGGEGLALGYLNQAELTQKTFIENPYFTKGHPSKRLYKTGDIARYRSNGDIEYLGRSDHQIKIRGLRVELGEIEAALCKLPNIKESIVILKESSPSNQYLLAYLLTDENIDKQTISQALKISLPDYMVPSLFIAIDKWPLSANGKIDKKRLPEPDTTQTLADNYAAPRNDTEETLTQIWATLLGVEKVGINDNFFELGGHSLLATQMASRIRTSFACSLELKAIFEYPTIAELAVHLLEKEMQNLDLSDEDLLALLDELGED
jgi:amino acid adenylation domain-containing protein